MNPKMIATGTVHDLPTDMQNALVADPAALEKWEDITPLARNEWICWVTFSKKDETRKEHVERMLKELKEGMRRPCCWIGCIHRTDKAVSPSVQSVLNRRSNPDVKKVSSAKAKKPGNAVQANAGPSDWRGKRMARIGALIKQAAPEAVEEVKYRTASNPAGALVWSHDGVICIGGTLKDRLRFDFAKGPALKSHDRKGLITTYRGIIIHEGDKLDEAAFKELIRAAVALNREGKRRTTGDGVNKVMMRRPKISPP